MWTRRVPISITKNTYSRRSNTVSTCRKSHASNHLPGRNFRQVGSDPRRRRAKLRAGKDPADPCPPHPIIESKHFALDPAVPPQGTPRGETDHQLADLDSDRRATRPVRESPVPGDQRAVPAQQRAGRHQPKTAQPAREQPAQRGKNRPVGQSSSGRPACRPSTATSWRKTTISASLAASLRLSNASQPKHTSHHQVEQPQRHGHHHLRRPAPPSRR